MISRAALAVGATVALAMSGCAPLSGPADTALPSGISISVYQTRTDVAERRLEVAVRNDTERVLTITGLVFDSPQFAAPVRWVKDSTRIRPGTEVDLPVLLADASCTDERPVATVTLDYSLEGAQSGTAVTQPVDRIDRLPELELEDCIAVDVAAIAEITPPAALRFGTAAGVELALIDLAVAPTGAGGSLLIDSVLSTTLLEVADPGVGAGLDELPLDLTVDSDDADSVLTVAMLPGRCDPHSIAEDKRGTIVPLSVIVDGVSGILYLTTADAVRAELYAFVKRVCGLP